jgi:hypothetical protein
MKQRSSSRQSRAWIPIVLVTVAALVLGVGWVQPPWFVRAFDLRGDRGAIAGTVTDEYGVPVEQARVQFLPRHFEGPSCGFGAATDAQGAFVVRGPEAAEPALLIVGAAGFATLVLDGVQGGNRQVRIALERAAPLRLRLRVPSGTAAAEFRVSVRRKDWSGSGPAPNASKKPHEDGSLEFDDFPAGAYEMLISRCRDAGPGVALGEPVVLRAGETTDLGMLELPDLLQQEQ